MTTKPIICSGSDLSRVLADIAARGDLVEALDCAVQGNSGYRVHYFDGRAAELADATVDAEKRLAVATTDRAMQVQTLPRSPNVAGRTSLICEVTGKSQRGMTNGRNPTGNSEPVQFPHQGETPAAPAAPEAVKSAVAPRNQLNGVQSPRQAPASGSMPLQKLGIENPASRAETAGVVPSKRLGGANPAIQGRRDDPQLESCPVCTCGPLDKGSPCPICDGLARIRAGARRFRGRFRTGAKEARLPHAD